MLKKACDEGRQKPMQQGKEDSAAKLDSLQARFDYRLVKNVPDFPHGVRNPEEKKTVSDSSSQRQFTPPPHFA
ncbi:MAG: hypothetical protein K6U09_09695 [Acidobacteriia bacterium]|nr:hypothetical protein [Terriglobia bacterium]